MKLVYTILLFLSFQSNATIYYVSNAGSDVANGTSTGTSWQTISKVNSSTFAAGDQILFKKGDIWNERLNPPSSGSSGNVITFGAYGTGVKPIITGLQTQTGFTNVGNIWTATATNSVKKLNTVLISGVMRAKGRYPNYGYLTYTSHSGQNQITGSLTGTPNYTGGEAVVRVYHWIIDVCTITSQSGGTLNLTPNLTYEPFNNYGYFIQNIASVLDTTGEWCYDSATKVLKVYSSVSPIVQISTIDTLVYLRNKNYITFDGISFTGANKTVFQMDTARSITIQNCAINYSGNTGISAKKSPHAIIQNDSIKNTWNNAIYMRQVDPYTPSENVCDSSTIEGNYILNTGTKSGMGVSNNGQYNGININGFNLIIKNNRVDSTGYNGITWQGANALIYRNYVSNFCLVKTEGGGIYTVIGAYLPDSYSNDGIIRGNIIVNGEDYGVNGTPDTDETAAGIFLDNQAEHLTLDSNTISNCMFAGIVFNDARTILYTDNTILNNIGNCINGTPLGLSRETQKRNVFYSTNNSLSLYYLSGDAVVPTNQIDSNFYVRPINEDSIIQRTNQYYSLASWQIARGYDIHSHGVPAGITSAAPLFYFNPTNSDSTISLAGTFIDAKGVQHINSITLSPYKSTILFTSSIQNRVTGRVGNLNFTQ
jgi:hypothetical protein